LNLIPRRATPVGTMADASIVSHVQMMLIEVAAMAVVPWPTAPVSKSVSLL
jgi:hypothetical protein